jgi:rhodanese-related sulfurtransferase
MKKILFVLGIIAILLFIAGCVQETAEPEQPEEEMPPALPGTEPEQITFMDVSPAEAKNLIDTMPDLVVIDVSPHYDAGHLPGAVHYYLGDGSLDAAIPNLDPNGKYLVYCHIDSVAINGAQKLIDAGFTTVYRLEGNYGAWVAAGYPVE